MFSLNETNKFMVYTGVDLRKGVEPLCGLARRYFDTILPRLRDNMTRNSSRPCYHTR